MTDVKSGDALAKVFETAAGIFRVRARRKK
jgi:hypothetical protein